MLSTITGTITTLVTPGSGNYAANLTIGSTGTVANSPTAIAADGFATNNVTNLGQIDGQVFLYFGDTLTNAGHINGGTIAVRATGSDTITNRGTITGTEIGVELNRASKVVNSGLIQGGNAGLYAQAGGYILNTGVIKQASFTSGFEQVGMYLVGGTLKNIGTISGLYGMAVQNGSIINSGTIEGQSGGILVKGGTGLLDNTGKIIGNIEAIYSSGGTIENAGTVTALVTGIKATGQQQIINSGSLYGESRAISLQDGGSVTNAGTIKGGQDAILNTSTSLGVTLTVDPGAVFSGTVLDDSGVGELILGGTGTGTLNMAGTFTGFSQISFGSGSTWTLEGTAQELANGETITGLSAYDSILLEGFKAKTETFISGTGLILSNGTTTETLDIVGNFANTTITVTSNGTGSEIDLTPAPCFCAGTRIATARGNVPVETLRTGDLVQTATQGLQPIRWIGRRSYDGRMIAGNHLALPVKIRRHAFAFNVPSRDLYISPDHSLCEGGVLVHAWRFINGVSITQAQNVETVEYYNIELESHAVIFAENTPVESYLDTGCRNRYQNADTAPPRAEAQVPCLQRVQDGYYLARLQERINARAGIALPQPGNGPMRGNIDTSGPMLSGWAQDETTPETAVELELVSNGQVLARFLANRYRVDLRRAGLGSGCHAFEMPLPPLSDAITLRRVTDGAILGGPAIERRRKVA